MTQLDPQHASAGVEPSTSDAARLDHGIHELSALLRALDESAANSGRGGREMTPHENQLVQVRLGIASSLFMALRCKHAATASHSLRVALGCSAWTLAMEIPDYLRDQIEVAALLHDVGKIGVPDHILLKPGTLSPDEALLMDQHRQMGLQILGCCCAPEELLDIVTYAPAWFDGSRGSFDRSGKELPLGARILAIVDAFDSMTTDHVYRRAKSRDRALAELFECAGTQFDPELVQIFCELHARQNINLQSDVSQRWLESLVPDLANQNWQLQSPEQSPAAALPHPLFQQKLLDNMHDGVAFVDTQGKIFLWNTGAERLTGISGEAAFHKLWMPEMLEMRNEKGRIVRTEECPVAQALQTGMQTFGRFRILSRDGKELPIDVQVIPVTGRDGTKYGVTVLLHDASNETSLEEKCENLHSQATKDPMTQVANRAEFDRVHPLFIKAHVESGLPASLIICDIDHFKQVNDNWGHPAGDDAIKTFAKLLQSYAKHGDLVARYGGEEFVMLCADCNNASAASRAETIRRALMEIPQAQMNGRHITASFGVTENQPGDTPATMLRRADRALLE
ncbi:MAG: diguanylate cyclase, partial [Planctomycetales bacterium]|nr:diguanylate cyclase [Planctomycetales bacterium]